eukprot:COSAG02_NODE_5365_length_4397_cov_2.696603_6_plen_49_part_01
MLYRGGKDKNSTFLPRMDYSSTSRPPNLGNRMQSARSDLHAGIQIAYAS